MLAPWKKSYDPTTHQPEKQRHYFPNKGLSSQSYGFASNHVWMLEMDHKESWVLRIHAFELWCWRKLLRVPWISKKFKPVNPKINQCWKFIGKTGAEAETPILWPPDVKNWLIWKDSDAGKDWRREEKGRTEDEMVGWHYWLNGHEFEWALGVGDEQGSLVCCSPWGRKESDMTELLLISGEQGECDRREVQNRVQLSQQFFLI